MIVTRGIFPTDCNPGHDRPGHLAAVLLQHHHVSVAAHALLREFHVIHLHARLPQELRGAVIRGGAKRRFRDE